MKIPAKVSSVDMHAYWHNPAAKCPPFDRWILIALGSWADEGLGFKPHMTITTAKIACADADGDRDEGREMMEALAMEDWHDFQFQLVDDDGEPMDTYSDSIIWWSAMPPLPDYRAG